MYNILICDDDKDIVNALKIYLQNPDYRLFEAFNGVEATELAEKEDIHLILMDIMMPQMDGITAMAKIREKFNMPIILLTAKSEDQDKILGLNIGADDYITKPFNPLEVAARVGSQLRRYTKLGSGTAAKELLTQRIFRQPRKGFTPCSCGNPRYAVSRCCRCNKALSWV